MAPPKTADLFGAPQDDVAPARAFDEATWVYTVGRRILRAYGIPESRVSKLIANWLQSHQARAVLLALVDAGKAERGDIISYLFKALPYASGGPTEAIAPFTPQQAEEAREARVRGLIGLGMGHLIKHEDYALARAVGWDPLLNMPVTPTRV